MHKRGVVLALAGFSLFTHAAAAAVLFPEPLHLTRSVENPFTQKTTVVDEYCVGNRVISVTEDRTVIADYEKGELTEIDRAHATYSVTRFEDLAKAYESATPSVAHRTQSQGTSGPVKPAWNIKPAASHRSNAEYVEAEPADTRDVRRMEVGIDRSVRLSRDAAEVLAGVAYPSPKREENSIVLDAAAPSAGSRRAITNGTASADNSYGLPVEQVVTYRIGAKEIVSRSRITRVTRELPPGPALLIPNGARLVPSSTVQRKQLLDDIERLPPSRGRP